MKKVISLILALVQYVLIAAVGLLIAFVLFAGLAEGDLSHGLWYYLG